MHRCEAIYVNIGIEPKISSFVQNIHGSPLRWMVPAALSSKMTSTDDPVDADDLGVGTAAFCRPLHVI